MTSSTEANGRPRQIKSNGHLSCWQLKSYPSNYTWCLASRSNRSFQHEDKWCGARDCFRDQWTSSGSELNWKTINTRFTSYNIFAACDVFLTTASHLSLRYWRQEDLETIDTLVRGQSLSYNVFCRRMSRPHITLKPHLSDIMGVQCFTELRFFLKLLLSVIIPL